MIPAAALQEAVVAALSASAELEEAFGGAARIYDRPPNSHINEFGENIDGPQFPYVTVGEDQIVDDSNTCDAAFEAFVTVHVWSRAVGRIEAKRIGDAAGGALNTALAIDDFVCLTHEFQSARYFTEPDGLTTHGVVTARFLIRPA